VEPDQLPRRPHHLLYLPSHFESFPSKRCKFIKRGTQTSTYQTCDHTRMSTELSQKYTGSPSTSIPTIVNGTPFNTFNHNGCSGGGSYHHPCSSYSEYSTYILGPFVTHWDITFSPSLWPLALFLMVCRISHRNFQPPSQCLV